MRVWLRTFGCRANQADSEAVRAMVVAGGGTLVDDAVDADVAVFNSCAVTADAEAGLRQAVRRAARTNPRLQSVVMGCAAALDRGAIAALPSVGAVVGGTDLTGIALALGLPSSAAHVIATVQTGARALLRIQDGCDEHCTFCATTIARGPHRSRPAGALVADATMLAATHPEIVLTGVHIGSYGSECHSSLGALLERLVTEVPRVRFRLSSVEATEVDDRLRALLRDGGDRVAPYLHAPLQSGSDRVLRRMGRHWYAAATYRDAVERVIDGRAVFGLGADLIAGFPGETDDDHAATLALIDRLPFTALHVFPYSVRPGTAAERLPGRVTPPVIAVRAAELRDAGARKGAAYAATRDGSRADVVITGTGGGRVGLTEDYLSVHVDDGTLPRRSRVRALLVAGPDGRLVARTMSPTVSHD